MRSDVAKYIVHIPRDRKKEFNISFKLIYTFLESAHGSRGNVKAPHHTITALLPEMISNIQFMADVHPFYRAERSSLIYNFHSQNNFHYFAGGRRLIDQTRGKEFAHFACHPLLRPNNFPTSAKLILRERESLPLSPFLSLSCVRSRDRNWNERMARGRVLSRGLSMWSPDGPFAIPAGFSFAAQLSIPSR